EKLARADRAGAVTDLEAAQSAIGEDAAHPDYWNVRLALAEAHVVDAPTEAQIAFLEVAGRKPGGLTAREYATFGQRLSDAKHYQQAVLVVDRGLDAHTAEAKLKDLMDRIKRDAQASGDQGTLDLLESLGYL
ncbi:MAG TPA: hypothetical protein VJP77_05935, partial [Planctomycetota bacterium]|nr:hypothetical protein [Planctomycetota bacterium]